jgi:hypothetical protein
LSTEKPNYNNRHCCLNPGKYIERKCKECKFFDGCILPDKLMGYKLGKPITYADFLKKEAEENAKQQAEKSNS